MWDFKSWLESIGLARYVDVFGANDIDFDVIADLSEVDFKELGVSMGDRKRLLTALSDLHRADYTQGRVGSVQPQAERRQLTVMFCDLVGSTPLSVQYDPEDYREIIRRYQACCDEIVRRFNGYVARYMGDGLLVFFGFPQADEHDSERSVRTGLEIVQSVRQLDVGVRLQARVGIATGEVVVGDLIGEGASMELSAAGRTPNLAARLQTMAEPDTVVVSEATRALVGDLFEYKDLGKHRLKGFDEPIQVYEVGAELSFESRFEATRGERSLTSLVGRNREFEQLWLGWNRAKHGEGRAILLVGEAGIGKSRLTHALRERIAWESHHLLRYYGVPYFQDSPLYPVIKQLERAAELSREDTSESRLDKIENLLSATDHDLADTVPAIASLLSTPTGERYAPLNLSPERQMERTLDAIESLLVGLAKTKPVLILFEDLHWVDSTTLELLNRTLRHIVNLPVLIVMTHRPEFASPFVEPRLLSRVSLGKLGRDQSTELVLATAGGKSLPTDVMEHILDKTDGVALFIEELTKNILESGLLEDRGDHYTLSGPLPLRELPSTLQDSLMARIDRLGSVKDIIQLCSVIGRRFTYALLDAVAMKKGLALKKALDKLIDAGLIFSHESTPEVTFTFSHALVQDAAYSSLLRDRRRTLHARIAEALEEKFPATIGSEPELLARHYTEARRPANAIAYWQLAGKRAGEQAAYAEAIKHLDAGLDLLEDLPEDTTQKQYELGLKVLMGHNLTCTQGYAAPRVIDTFNTAHELCQALGRPAELFPVIQGLYRFYLVRADIQTALELAEKCVELGQRSENPVHLVEGTNFLGYVRFYKGDLNAAVVELERSLAMSYEHRDEQLAYLSPEHPGVSANSLLGVVHALKGDIEQARNCSQNAIDLARRHKNPFGSAYAHSYAAHLCDFLGEWEEMAGHASTVVDISNEHGFDIWLKVGRANLDIAKGVYNDPEVGIPLLDEQLSQWRLAGIELNIPLTLIRFAGVHLAAGHSDQALEYVNEALDFATPSTQYWLAPSLLQFRGLVRQLSGDLQSAESDFTRSTTIAGEQGARLFELRAMASLYALLDEQGRGAEQRSEFALICDRFPGDCVLNDVVQARQLLAAGGSSQAVI